MSIGKAKARSHTISACRMLDATIRSQSELATLNYVQPLLDAAKVVVVYNACDWEFDVQAIATYCLEHGKQVYQPLAYLDSKKMLLIKYNKNCRQIFSDRKFTEDIALAEQLEWYNTDLVLLPVVAVDKSGYRLGRGGGYYDYTLSSLRERNDATILCGIGYGCQQLDYDLPHDTWDIPLDYFVSERGLVKT